MRRQTNSLTGDLGLRVVYLACSIACLCFLALVLALAAYMQFTPKDVQARDAGRAVFGAAASNPWTVLPHPPDGTSPPDNASPNDQTLPGPSPASLDSPDPQARRRALDAWFQSRPDSLQEISRMLDDPDPAVQAHARLLWDIALSGGREMDSD